MTVIAHFTAFGIPTLLGDLLISSSEHPGRSVHIPASRNINERILLQQDHYVVGLCQKLVVLNDNLAIAWSKSFAQANELLSTLEPLQSVTNVDANYVRAAINAIDDRQKDDLAIIALIAAPDQSEIVTFGVERTCEFGSITQVVCAGSGGTVIREILRQFATNVISANPDTSIDDLREGFDLTLLQALAGEEIVSTIPLQQGWGGGFEVIRLANGRLQKNGSNLSLVFFIDCNDWTLNWVPNFRHTGYWRDQTIVQAIEHEVDVNRALLPGRRDVFIVGPPTNTNPDLSDFSPPDIHVHEAVMSSIFVPDGCDEHAFGETLTYAAAYTQPVIRYDAPTDSQRVNISFCTAFIQDVLEYLQQRLGQRISFAGASNRPSLHLDNF